MDLMDERKPHESLCLKNVFSANGPQLSVLSMSDRAVLQTPRFVQIPTQGITLNRKTFILDLTSPAFCSTFGTTNIS